MSATSIHCLVGTPKKRDTMYAGPQLLAFPCFSELVDLVPEWEDGAEADLLFDPCTVSCPYVTTWRARSWSAIFRVRNTDAGGILFPWRHQSKSR